MKNDKKVINRSKNPFSPFYLRFVKNLPKTLVFYLNFGISGHIQLQIQ
jgi:hypothetical protein